ncbi:MAG: dihydroxyacetone kinase, phosphotransfer subunit [Actinotalea sp.]|nr:dihydroxyacetone kinase, phosphotransfer subunit [Actinotalea sp.]
MAHVALLLVSHSAEAAEGTAQIARQMAPEVEIVAAGGVEHGIGTSVERVQEALERLGAGLVTTGWEPLRQGAGVVVLTDLGSAVLTAETVLELVDPALAALVRIPTAPFVEGAVTAAVEAQQDGDLDAVADAAVRAGALFADAAQVLEPARSPAGGAGGTGSGAAAPGATADEDLAGSGDLGDVVVSATVVLDDPAGLHARPAASLARAVSDLGVPVTIDGVDGRSVLELLQLGATHGQELTVAAVGPGAAEAVAAVVGVLERLGAGRATGAAPVA